MESKTAPLTPIIRLLVGASLTVAAVLLHFTAPVNSDFWWSDASRHAMNGAFFYEFFSDFPVWNIREWAVNFYLRRPAIAIGFYPPLFGLIVSVFYAIFGTSHAAAQFAVTFFAMALGVGAFQLSRRWISPLSSLAIAFLILGVPEMALWGRQVMLEIPTYAFLVWAVHFFLLHLARKRFRDLLLSVFFYVGALYIKLSVVFLFPVFLGFLIYHFGLRYFRVPRIGATVVGFVISLIPLVWMTLEFGGVNVGAVAGGQASDELPRTSVANWLYYIRVLPEWVGPIGMLLLGGCFLLGMPGHRKSLSEEGAPVSFLVAWLISGYVFFSVVALKEPRHGVFLLLPMLILIIHRTERAVSEIHAGPPILIVAVLVFCESIFWRPVPFVGNHALAADFVAENTPPGYRVMIHSYWDGNFIFHLWSRGDREDMAVLRSDKILLRMAVKRTMGVEERKWSREELGRFLDENGIYYIVCEKGFWDDIEAMRNFEEFLGTDSGFIPVADFPISSNTFNETKRLVVYRNLTVSFPRKSFLRMELPIIDREFFGELP